MQKAKGGSFSGGDLGEESDKHLICYQRATSICALDYNLISF
jgi:hypothetical protein